MFNNRYSKAVVLLAAIFAFVVGFSHAAEEVRGNSTKEKEQKLIAVLQSDAPPQEKAITCKHLAICGTKDAVPALAALLSNEQLASWARIALEAIPDPAADDALRESLVKLQGKLLVGAINSIGVRRDVKATERIAARLNDTDAELASAAAVALGRIGTAESAKPLAQALSKAPLAVRSAVAEGCILCAEKFLAVGKSDEAAKLYEAVCKVEVPKQRILEATRGLILARQSAGIPLLVEQLRSSDKSFFELGLRTARDLPGGDVTDALVAELVRMPSARRPLLVLALADRNDAKVLPALLQAAKSSSEAVRLTAIGSLERLGDRTCVPVLIDAAQEADGDIARAAVEALANLSDEAVNVDIAERLPAAEGSARLVLIQVAGLRRIAAAKPALLKAVEDPAGSIRDAAIVALGEVSELGDLPMLIAHFNLPGKTDETTAAPAVLRAACLRMPDREACAEKLIAALPPMQAPNKRHVLDILGEMGGVKALQAVGARAKDADPEIKEAASRLLGRWPTADAAPVLLDLAKTAAEEKYRLRALRGYLRIARQFDLPDAQRIEMCREAIAVAARDDEKKMAVEVLGIHPSLGMLRIAAEAGKSAALKPDAARSALLIAQKIGDGSDEVRKMLAELGLEAAKVEIVRAEYGSETKFKDVTATLQQRVGKYPLILFRSGNYNNSFSGDPAPGKAKTLRIKYKINGTPGEVSLPENAPILLPRPQ
jgi:HEAT repeat protein